MSSIEQNVTNFPINVGPISASEKNAQKAKTWAEGTDVQVSALGGTHSAKGWAEVAQELVGSIGTVMHYKGSVANYAALQAIVDPELGDTYNVLDTGNNYAWNGTAWDQLSGTVDLSAYRTAEEQDVIDAKKLENTATGTESLTLGGTASTNTHATNVGIGSYTQGNYSTATGWHANATAEGVAIGSYAEASGTNSIAIGGNDVYSSNTRATYPDSIAIGDNAKATAARAIQLGSGTNSTQDAFNVGSYTLLDGTTGKIPSGRIPDILPSQTGNNGKFLTTDGSSASWAQVNGGIPTLYWFNNVSGNSIDTQLDLSNANLVKVYLNGVLKSEASNAEVKTCTYYTNTASNYITFNNIYDLSNADSWEFSTRFVYTTPSDSWPLLVAPASANWKTPAIIRLNGKWGLLISSTGSSWNVTGETTYWTWNDGTKYDLKFGHTGTQYYVQGKSAEDSTASFEDLMTPISSTAKTYSNDYFQIFNGTGSSGHHAKGSINMTRTTLTKNGSIVFSGEDTSLFTNSGCTTSTVEEWILSGGDYVINGSTITFPLVSKIGSLCVELY